MKFTYAASWVPPPPPVGAKFCSHLINREVGFGLVGGVVVGGVGVGSAVLLLPAESTGAGWEGEGIGVGNLPCTLF